MSDQFDVVVVGGRVAGASTALLLARAGVRVAVVDRSAYGSDALSTHGFMRAGVLQLSRWGLLDEVVAAGTPPIRRTTFHYADGESVDVSIRPGAGVDALYAPRRYLLDRILVDAAARAGADIRHDTTVTGLVRDAGGRVSGVRTLDRAGRTAELRATVTVGADGVRSTVADAVDAPVRWRGRFGSAILYRHFEDIPASGYEWGYGPGAAAGVLPTNDSMTCVFVGTTPQRMRALRRDGTEHAFATLLSAAAAPLTQRMAAARPAGRMHGWAAFPGLLRRAWGPGWALVGDAGYFKDPISTHGMTDALRDAELLADQILEAIGGVTPQAVALARYEARRNRLSRPLFEATEAVASYDWQLAQVRSLLRNVSSAMSDEVDHLQTLPERNTRARELLRTVPVTVPER
ncbi:MAG TPA: NAD(P)/FAD-dependent oxidoreductase [Jatrophihabitans sp.]|jgi:flavin-dependent dehydrogenase